MRANIGLKDSPDIPDPATEKSFQQLLNGFKKGGGALYICPTAMKELGIDAKRAMEIFESA